MKKIIILYLFIILSTHSYADKLKIGESIIGPHLYMQKMKHIEESVLT